jgi:hypothetical protein
VARSEGARVCDETEQLPVGACRVLDQALEVAVLGREVRHELTYRERQ